MTLFDSIQEVRGQFPEGSRSATIPALRLAQEQYGWLPEAIREVADALDLTPAYCHAVASFYDMFHLEPIGKHLVEVCTNLSCALVGAQEVVDAFESELGICAGSTTRDGAITFRTCECLGGCGYATVVSVDGRYRQHVTAAAVPEILRTVDGARSVLLAGADERDLTKLAEYQAIGGYDGVPKARALAPEKLIEELLASNLRGRGGAGFPMGRKASLIDRASSKPKYLVVNADESEPGAFKDREVMARVPHRLIEGCLIAAHAIECKDVFIYIRGEYLNEYEILERAVSEARAAGLFGDVEITVYRGAGAYICGEETALLDSLEGRRGQPRPRPPFPPVQGLFNAPTQINNVCTIATVPSIIELGPEAFTKIGVQSSPGTAIFSISGNVVRPGNYELELGTPMRDLIYDFGGGIAGGRELKAVIPGGSSVPALSPDQIDVPLDYDSLGALGTFFGAASLIVVDDRCCMVQLALRSTKFYMHESCGKCTPCREGTRWMVQILERLEAGDGSHDDIELLKSVGSRILGKSLCALGDFAVYPVASYIAKWGDEFAEHVELGRCPFDGESSIEGIVAPSDAHTHAHRAVTA